MSFLKNGRKVHTFHVPKSNQHTLQKTPNRTFRGKRAFPSIFSHIKRKRPWAAASLTLETALVLPMFMLFVLGVLYFLIMISLQLNVQLHMEEAARKLDKSAYLASESINAFTIRQSILTDDLRECINHSRITGGVSGFRTAGSSYDADTGILDLVVSYQYTIPFLPGAVSNVHCTQRSYSRAWIGKSLSEDGMDGNSADDPIVYITPNGTVYHTTQTCNYLDLSIHTAPLDEMDDILNASGEHYEKCPLCAKGTRKDTVYITDYGSVWHNSLTCIGLKRSVIAVKLSEVGSRKACSKCGGS